MKVYKVLSILTAVLMMIILSSCATSNEREPAGDGGSTSEVEEYSKAAPEAYGMGFFVQKAAPKHKESQPIDFFYKHCTGNMERVWYSKTSYECERP